MLVEPFHNVYKRICFRVDFVDGMTVVGIDDHSENKYTVVSKQNYIVLFYYLNLFEGERRMEGEGWGRRG